MKKVLAVAALLFISHFGFTQTRIRTQLSGKVTDAKTGEALQGASVVIADSRLGTSTNSEGTYTFNNLAAGHAIIEVSYSGFETVVDHVDIGRINQQNFQLK